MPPRSRWSARSPTTPRRRWPTPPHRRAGPLAHASWPSAPRSSATLREIAARITGASDLSEVLQRAVDEAARLIARRRRPDRPPRRPDRHASLGVRVRDAAADDSVWPDDPRRDPRPGRSSGQAVVTGPAVWTGDYLARRRFPHGIAARTPSSADVGIRSVMAVPLIGDAGPFGALTVYTGVADAWTRGRRGAARGPRRPGGHRHHRTPASSRSSTGPRAARPARADAEQALREIAARITALRDPAEILQEVVEQASRLLGGGRGDPRPARPRRTRQPALGVRRRPRPSSSRDEERAKLWISVGVGATGVAVAEDRVVDRRRRPGRPVPAVARVDTILRADRLPLDDRGADHAATRSARGASRSTPSSADAFDEGDADLIRALADQARHRASPTRG